MGAERGVETVALWRATFTGGSATIHSVFRHFGSRDPGVTERHPNHSATASNDRPIITLASGGPAACRAPDPSLPRANHAPRRLGAAQPHGSSFTRCRLVANCPVGHPWSPISRKGGGDNHRERERLARTYRESESHRGLFFLGPPVKAVVLGDGGLMNTSSGLHETLRLAP